MPSHGRISGSWEVWAPLASPSAKRPCEPEGPRERHRGCPREVMPVFQDSGMLLVDASTAQAWRPLEPERPLPVDAWGVRTPSFLQLSARLPGRETEGRRRSVSPRPRRQRGCVLQSEFQVRARQLTCIVILLRSSYNRPNNLAL
ncbi:hypothetical protein PYCC9005_001574 [Savitreella phatthalungensis]